MSQSSDEISTQELDAALNATSVTNPLVSINNQTYVTACIEYLQAVLPEDELPGAIVHCSTSLENDASDAWGSQGGQFWSPPTTRPTVNPTHSPTTASPTTIHPSEAPSISPSTSLFPTGASPTYHPTLHDKLFVLRGTIYYDRNANGRRDADVQSDLSGDTEYEIGLGGVNLRLVECDLETNSAVKQQQKPGPAKATNSNGTEGDQDEDKHWNSYSQTVSLGYDVLLHPTLADRSVDGGKYNMIDIKVNRAYYIQAEAPAGYLFTGGVCNNAVPGWKCPSASTRKDMPDAADSTKALQNDKVSYADSFTNGGENALGLREGRSIRCVSVDRTGRVDGILDLGVMKVGDVLLDHTEVRLSLDLANVDGSLLNVTKKDEQHDQGQGDAADQQRSLLHSILAPFYYRQQTTDASLEEKLLRHATHIGNGRYLLNEDDRYAIGVVAAEVLAASLDHRLSKNMVELDHISPKEVVLTIAHKEAEDGDKTDADAANTYAESNVHSKGQGDNRVLRNTNNDTNSKKNSDNSNTRPVINSRNPSPRRTNRLTVDLEVWGHYPPQLNVDFDYIVQDSINRETEVIREELKDYNTNCDDQTEKVYDHGYLLNDFEEIYSNKGVTTNHKRKAQWDGGAEEQVSMDGGVFRTACSNDVKLPEYFEKSLDEIKVTTMGKVVILEEPSGTPMLVIGLLVALLVVMLIGGLCIYRIVFMKKSDNDKDLHNINNDGQWTDYGSKVLSVSTQLQSKTDEEIKQRMNSVGSCEQPTSSPPARMSFFRRKLGNVSSALNAERRRISARFGGVRRTPSESGEQKNNTYSRSRTLITHLTHHEEKSCVSLEKSTYDESTCRPGENSTISPLDEDHVDAEERIKAFERRMMTMKAQMAQNKSLATDKEDRNDDSTVSSRPIVPTNIKFSSQYEKKSSVRSCKSNKSIGSCDFSSSSLRKERQQKTLDKKNDQNSSKPKKRPRATSAKVS